MVQNEQHIHSIFFRKHKDLCAFCIRRILSSFYEKTYSVADICRLKHIFCVIASRLIVEIRDKVETYKKINTEFTLFHSQRFSLAIVEYLKMGLSL